ncbi:multidrug resistance-associated ABC transporter [Flagelloscypha sp. PMI_526]|nr:multidrug resistance-associated ABC transporter [Flagelloscypha sp. PMI_526]
MSCEVFELQSQCTLIHWAAYLPLSTIIASLLKTLFDYSPLEPILSRKLAEIWFFTPFLTLEEALDATRNREQPNNQDHATLRPWPLSALPVVTLVQTLFWLAIGIRTVVVGEDYAVPYFVIASTWIYATLRPTVKPSRVIMWDLFLLSLAHIFGAIFLVYRSLGQSTLFVAVSAFNIVLAFAFYIVHGFMPLAVPSHGIRPEDVGKSISSEDYTSLLGWITFMWTYPIMRKGRKNTLNEDDVPELSPTFQARPLFEKCMSLFFYTILISLHIGRGTHLAVHVFRTNSFDFFLEWILTLFSVICEYASPFFLKLILDTIDNDTHPNGSRKSEEELFADRRKAVIYAFMLWLAGYMKAVSDVNHLWFGRRALTRTRTVLMTAIYDKALKRVSLTSTRSQSMTEKEGAAVDTTQPKKGADLGKVINLMTADMSKIYNFLVSAWFMYANPFQLVIAAVFLFKLLGWSAFVGFSVLLLGMPLNTWLSKRTVAIAKKINLARDKRMTVVTEVISSIKFIKFFAWEENWVDRTMEKRRNEIKQIIRARINEVFYTLYWMATPVAISVLSFTTYVATGNELTIGTAFTALQLFAMVRVPLNALPNLIVQTFTAWISLQRIATYLDEEEVSSQVSSLLSQTEERREESEGFDGHNLSLDHATLKWNEVNDNNISATATKRKWFTLARMFMSQQPALPSTNSPNATPTEDTNHKFELKDITVTFPEGKLSLIVGPTACGKTAMLMSLLGEMTLVDGRLIMSKNASSINDGLIQSFAYAAQVPWLRHQSIKDNILFGYPFDEKRYGEVVESCALQPDFEMLEDGDRTEIGAGGVSLSGGQKARVALARAVYSPAKYVLLDDPLSAVDSHTSRFLFERLLSGPLLANRTVILVTHHVELVLPAASYLVHMLDGRIDFQGSITDLRERGLLDDVTYHENALAKEDVAEKETVIATAVPPEYASVGTKTSISDAAVKMPRKLVENEHREERAVKLPVYNTYLKSSGYWVWALMCLGVIFFQTTVVGEKLWINIWGSASEARTKEHSTLIFSARNLQTVLRYSTPLNTTIAVQEHHWPDARQHPLYYVGIFAAICFSSALLQTLSAIFQYLGAVRASKVLFRNLLVSVVRATFRFHDTTPAGRLLNRFGKDVETIDDQLANKLWETSIGITGFVASLTVIAVVFPVFLLPAAIIFFLYLQITITYLNSARDLRRMEANTRSPIFSTFSELLDGIVTVRAFSKEKQFLDEFYGKVDLTTKIWYSFWMANRFLLLQFDTLGTTVTLVTCLLSISYLQGGAGLAGVCITSAMTFSWSIYWACRYYTELEMGLNSVERIAEYLEIPQEPPAVIESNRPPAYWPSTKEDAPLLTVRELEIKYAPELPSVLQGISFELKAGERVGLVGRTGSGKSTLAMSLFRFVDPSSGSICIDGLNIADIGIYDLRSRMTFIPQDATLFSGTIRDNLDPFGEHEDSECLDALYRVQLLPRNTDASLTPSRASSEPSSLRPQSSVSGTSTTATTTETKTTISLDSEVSAGGANFSHGQRQLIAMARALLRRSSIVVLDEATSSIDFITDTKIQQTIREEFAGALLITVAHRLRTIIDYDRLIILDKGKVAEIDTPLGLIEKEDSIFRDMCLKSGTFQELLDLARGSR